MLVSSKKLVTFVYEIEHRSRKNFGHADCMSRLSATTTALNMTATMTVDASVVGHPNTSPQNLPCFLSHNLPAHPSHSTTIPRDTIKSNQTDDDQLGVKHGNEAGVKKQSDL